MTASTGADLEDAPAPFAVGRKASAASSSSPVPRTRRFDRDEIIDSLRRWTQEFGEPPRVIDLEPARARRLGQAWRAERFEAGQWPSARMVTRAFRSMSAALSAAGIAPRPAPARTAANLGGSDAILDAIRAWVRLYGEVPTLADWDPSRARRLGQDWRIARYHRGDWPSTRTVISRFGSVSAAVAAAGLPPRPVGVHGRARDGERARAREAVAHRLSEGRLVGSDDLALGLRALVAARKSQDPTAIHGALIDIAALALAWAEVAGVDADPCFRPGMASS